ncbi:MAG: heme peroxidase family protein [Pirellulales bacterium]
MKKSIRTSAARGHGNRVFWIEGEGFVGASLLGEPEPPKLELVMAATVGSEEKPFRFCRMIGGLQPFRPEAAGLIQLGQAMSETQPDPALDSNIPAGFTYLGQFVDHDITSDPSILDETGEMDPAQIDSLRPPSVDLDSVYGLGPGLSPELFDGPRLKLGATTPTPFGGGNTNTVFPNDLPRMPPDPNPENDKRAIIGDRRNDENLAVAQTHLAFLKFHNKVVDRLSAAGTPAASLFDEARKVVTQHYQSIVLDDLVRRLVSGDVLNDVLVNGRKFFMPGGIPAGAHLCMPVEFSVAAYRLGHSMIRHSYEWNRVFRTGRSGGAASLALVFEFSALSGDLGGMDTLPSNWIVDWLLFYDFAGVPGTSSDPSMNRARQLDTRLASALDSLPEFATAPEPHLRSLAVRNLLRGRLIGLPTAQTLAGAMAIAPLAPAEIRQGPHEAVLSAHDFDERTPLWYYILKEAEVQAGGQRLGELGSRLLAETFHGLIEGSRFSILKEAGWKPSLPSSNPERFTMADLLAFVQDLNPLGN